MKNLPLFCLTAFISVLTLSAAFSAEVILQQNFDGGLDQTPYATARGGNPSPLAPGCGEIDGFFRLLNNTGSLQQSMYFLDEYDNLFEGYATNFITASFDLRISEAGSGFADGVNFSLVDTRQGFDFNRLFSDGRDAERTWLKDSLSWTFRVYDGNFTTLCWDTTEQIGREDNCIGRGTLYTANLSVNFATDGAYVSASMMNKATGQIITISENEFVSDLEPFYSNVVFGGRTGGQTINADLDNIKVVYNSDPYLRWTPNEDGRLTDDGPSWESGVAPVRDSGQTGQIYAGTNKIHSADGINGWHLLVTGGDTTITNDGIGEGVQEGGLRMSNGGTFTMEGGKFTSIGKTVVGNGGPLTTMTINGGHFTINGGIQVIGDNGPGTVTVNGGLYEVTGYTYVSHGNVGTINITDGVAKFADLCIGHRPSSTGTLNVSGGTVSTANISMGTEGGTGVLNVSDGKLTVTGTLLTNAHNGNASNSTIDISGGEVTIIGNLTVNNDAPAGSVTTINLSAGTLKITDTFSMPDHGAFNFTGGTLNAWTVDFDLLQEDSSVLSPGGDGALGMTTITGDYTLDSGTLRLDIDLPKFIRSDSGLYADLLTVEGETVFGSGALIELVFDASLISLDLVGAEFKIMDLTTQFYTPDLTSLFAGTYSGDFFWAINQRPSDVFGFNEVYLTLTVPEPSTWVLLALGGLTLGFAARRKYR